DRRNGLAPKADAFFVEPVVGQADRRKFRAAEHDVELGVAEHERVALVDQRRVDRGAERLRQQGAELEAAEAGAEHDDAHCHGMELPKTAALKTLARHSPARMRYCRPPACATSVSLRCCGTRPPILPRAARTRSSSCS